MNKFGIGKQGSGVAILVWVIALSFIQLTAVPAVSAEGIGGQATVDGTISFKEETASSSEPPKKEEPPKKSPVPKEGPGGGLLPQTGEAVQQYSALGAGFIVSAGLVFHLGKTRRKS